MMNQSMPRFENSESLERFLGNMKLQIFDAEFASLCKISPDSMQQMFSNSSKAFEKSHKKIHHSPKTIPRTAEQLLQSTNPRSVLTKRRNSDFDIEKEISLQSEFKIKKQEPNQFNQKPNQTSPLQNLSLPAPMPGMYSEEAKVDLQQSPKQQLFPDTDQNSQEKTTAEMKLEDTDINENSNSNSQLSPPVLQNSPILQQNTAGGAPGRTKFIQPIYVVFPNQTYGYVEVDVMDENAMKNLSIFIQHQQQQLQQQPQ